MVAEEVHNVMGIILRPAICVKNVVGQAIRRVIRVILVLSCAICSGEAIDRVSILIFILKIRKVQVDRRVRDALNAGQAISEPVNTWLDEVTKIFHESDRILPDNLQKRRRSTTSVWEVLVEHYETSRGAKGMLKKLELIKERQLGEAAERNEWLARDKKLVKDILEDLQDERVSVVGVYGEDGVGKTTLADKLLEEARQRSQFNTVAKAVVSEIVDVKRIQEEIAQGIGFSFRDGWFSDATEISMRATTSSHHDKDMIIRAEKLHERLEKLELQKMRRILIYLDNFICNMKLGDLRISVGIPIGCKIVLSTRSKDLCSQIGADKSYEVKRFVLLYSKKLFEQLVAPHGCEVTTDYLKTVGEVFLDRCGGLPLAISTLVKAVVKQENRSGRKQLECVKLVAKKLPPNISVPGKDHMVDLVSMVLKLSCKSITSKEMKSFFRLCCLFPGDSAIGVEELVRYGMGLGLFNQGNELDQSITDGIKWAKQLQALNMLMDVENGSDGLAVKMHDSFRRAAIAPISKVVTSDTFLVTVDRGWELEKKDTLAQKYAISVILSSRNVQMLSDRLKCTQLRILRLECCSFISNFHFDSNCFDEMKKLQVLVIKKVHFYPTPLPSLGSLKILKTLCLDGCTGVDCLISTITHLTSLEILSLRGSDISKVPESGLGQLTHLKVLDLTRCNKLKNFPSKVIAGLSHSLQGLYMLGSFNEWNTENAASLGELELLLKLKVLQIDIKVEHLPVQLPFINDSFCFAIRTADCNSLFLDQLINGHGLNPCSYGSQRKVLELQKLTINHSDVGCTTMKLSLSQLLKATEELRLFEVNGITSITNFSSTSNTNSSASKNWRKLTIDSCNDLECVITQRDPKDALSNLDCLELRSLPRLNQIYPAYIIHSEKSLSKLKVLNILDCQQLKCLPVGSGGRFPEALESLGIWYCRSLERVFATTAAREEGEQAMEEKDNALMIDLPNLHRLKIFGAHNLKTFSSIPHDEQQPFFGEKDLLPAIKILGIARVQLKEIWDSEMPAKSFTRLETLQLSSCTGLKNVVPSSQLSRLKELKKLDISYCDELEEIFERRSTSDGSGPFPIPLRELLLKNLSCLTRINLSYYKLQSLCFVSVGGCPSLDILFASQSAKSLVQLKHLHVTDCEGLQVIVGGGVENEVIELPELRRIRLYSLGSLQSFCSSSCPLKLPKLQSLEIVDCPILQRFSYTAMVTPMLSHVKLSNGKPVWHGELNTTVQHLLPGKKGKPKISTKEEGKVKREVEDVERMLQDLKRQLENFDSSRRILSDPAEHRKYLSKINELVNQIRPFEDKYVASESLQTKIKLTIKELEELRTNIS